MRRKIWLTVGMLAWSLFLVSCADRLGVGGQSPQSHYVQVTKVIDGDTIRIAHNNEEEKVRFLLIDTPELHHPQKGKQPLAEESRELTANLLDSGMVRLERDVSERDKYGRLLAYAYVEDCETVDASIQKLCSKFEGSVQSILLAKGLAKVAYVYPPDTKRVDEFRAIEKEARRQAIGIWHRDDEGIDNGKSPESLQGDPSVAFVSCAQAREAGETPMLKGSPGYSKKLDRDGDGEACEE